MATWPRLTLVSNIVIGLPAVLVGGWALVKLASVLVGPNTFVTNLITLPSLHGSLWEIRVAVFAVCVLLSLGLVAWGLWSLKNAKATVMARRNMVLSLQLILCVIAFEAVAHFSGLINLENQRLRSLIANPLCGDLFYRLSAPHVGRPSGHVFDPELGWAHSKNLAEDSRLPWPPAIDGRPKAWFFGDSFMQGVIEADQSPPAWFETVAAGRQAMNFGTAGYGLDQIVLSYQRMAPRIPAGDPVFIGVLTVDIDRAVLGFFGAYKPVYRNSGGGFTLHLPPSDHANNLAANSAGHVVSYSWAVLRTLFELIGTRFDRSEVSCEMAEKKEASVFVMDQAIATAKDRGHDLRWVLFVPMADFYKQRSWRYAFLASYLESRNQLFIDTKAILEQSTADQGQPLPDFFIPGDSHMNTMGNQAVGAAMAASLGGGI